MRSGVQGQLRGMAARAFVARALLTTSWLAAGLKPMVQHRPPGRGPALRLPA
jgi:hypothetical protein